MKQYKQQTNQIINHLLNMKYNSGLKLWYKTLRSILNTHPQNWHYSQFNNIYGTMEFINRFDPYVRSIINKRRTQIESYDYIINGDNSLFSFIEDNINILYDILFNVILYGKCLVHIQQNTFNYDLKIISPSEYFIDYDNEKVFLVETDYIEDDFIYFGNELFDVSALTLSLVPYSIAKEHCHTLNYNNNIYLNGFIQTSIAPEVVAEYSASGQLPPGQIPLEVIGNDLVDKVDALKETGGVISTPEGIEIAHKQVVNDQVANAYKLFRDEIKDEIEILILGQAGTTRNTDRGSYAKAKVMQDATKDITYRDIKLLEKIVNDIICYISLKENNFNKIQFKIKQAVDQDELYLAQVLGSIQQLNIKDDSGSDLILDMGWLKENFNIPFENEGKIYLNSNNIVANSIE